MKKFAFYIEKQIPLVGEVLRVSFEMSRKSNRKQISDQIQEACEALHDRMAFAQLRQAKFAAEEREKDIIHQKTMNKLKGNTETKGDKKPNLN